MKKLKDKIIKLSADNMRWVNRITDSIWEEIIRLKAIIDTGDRFANPENIMITTSIYSTGNQVIFQMTKESLKNMITSWFYRATHQAKLEEQSIEQWQRRLEEKERKLDWRLKENTVRSLNVRIKQLEENLAIFTEAAEKYGYVLE